MPHRVSAALDEAAVSQPLPPADRLILPAAAILILSATSAVFAADIGLKDSGYTAAPAYEWTGLYFGAHMGYAWGNSNWTANTVAPAEPFASGSLNLAQPIDSFRESGSFFGGAQIGYNYRLPGNFVIGAEADASGPSFQTPEGISIGASTSLASPSGPETYSQTVLISGTVRARLGYAAGNWLFYGTGGLA